MNCGCVCCQIERGERSVDSVIRLGVSVMVCVKPRGEVPPVVAIPREGLRYFVQSRTRLTQRFLVDLEAIGGLGWCGCENFHFQRFPEFRRSRKVCDHHRCWHIKEARSFLATIMIEKLGKAMDAPAAIDHARAATREGRESRRIYYLNAR